MSKFKTIYLIRHGQSLYNAYTHSLWNWITLRCCFDPKIYDPALSPKGEEQAKALHRRLVTEELLSKIQLVITSPLLRALQTTCYAFPDLSASTTTFKLSTSDLSPLQEPLLDLKEGDTLKMDTFSTTPRETSSTSSFAYATFSRDEKDENKKWSTPILVHPALTEVMDTCGDVGSSVSELKKRFPSPDFSHVTDHWWYHSTERGPRVALTEPLDHVQKRIQTFCEFLLSRSEENIAVVGHSQFFMRWTGKWKMKNCGIVKFYLDPSGVLQEKPFQMEI